MKATATPSHRGDRPEVPFRKVTALIKHTPMVPQSLRRAGAAFALLLTMAAVGLASGCGGGGSSQSVISTGFPAGNGTNSLVTPAASGPGTLTLTASNLTNPIFFAAPKGLSDSAASGCASGVCASSTSGALTLVPGTVYQTPSRTLFPSAITMRFQYTLPSGTDPQTLNVYYYDGETWQPATPTSGGFDSKAGVLTTSILKFQGGLYAVLSAGPPPQPVAAG